MPLPDSVDASLARAESIVVSHTSVDHGPIDLHVVTLGPSGAPLISHGAPLISHGAPLISHGAPLILCVHGWPENWYSWRHQMTHFAALGYRVAAMDVRGYGQSSRPEAIGAYTITELAGDVAAVINQLSSDGTAILFGHDWGAPIVWNTARLHPEAVRAVAGMSVPYSPASAGDPMELWELLYAEKFFYMRYFHEPGVAEAAFGEDLALALRKVYFAGSGDSPVELWTGDQPKDIPFLDFLIDPDPAPAWMNAAEMTAITDVHGDGPTHGWFNRYRAQGLDGAQIEPVGEPMLAQPTCFIAGENDIVRHFVPGMDLFADPGASMADYRGTTLVDSVGHWVQQEAPEATNAALEAFVAAVLD